MINWQYLFITPGKPPAPWVQDLNDLLHKEPYSLLARGCFWALAFFLFPIAGTVMLCWTGVNYVLYLTGYSTQTVDPGGAADLGVVVTGCDTGFGRDLALACHAKGYHVFAACLTKESFSGLTMLSKDDSNSSSRMTPIVVDVCSDKDVASMAKIVLEWANDEKAKKPRFLHAVVNNAGIGHMGLVDWLDLETYQKDMDVNCFGHIRVIKAFLPFLKTQYGGGATSTNNKYDDARIVNMTSMAGLVHGLASSPYSMSKFAAEGFSNSLRLELRDFGIKVVTMNPSFHGTPLTDDMPGAMRKQFKALPEDVQKRYGTEYFDKNVIEFFKLPKNVLWRAENVTRDLCRAVDLVHPATRYVTGMDARFALLLQRMMPDSIVSFTTPRFLHPPAFFENNGDNPENSKKEK